MRNRIAFRAGLVELEQAEVDNQRKRRSKLLSTARQFPLAYKFPTKDIRKSRVITG